MVYRDNPYNSSNTNKELPYTQNNTNPYNKTQPTIPTMTPAMTLPTGIPTGPPYGGATLTPGMSPLPSVVQTPQTVQNPYYTAGYLKRFIGRDVRVEFLIGTGGTLIDRIGTLLDVGASYIVIKPLRSNDSLMCDLYSIKFVTIYA